MSYRLKSRNLLLTLCLGLPLGACGEGLDPDRAGIEQQGLLAGAVYDQLKAVEAIFPLPASTVEVDMGTFNAATGTFSGVVSTYHYEVDPETRKPYRVRDFPTVQLTGINARLRFSVINRGATFEVTVGSQTVSAAAGQSTIVVDVGKANVASWTVRSAGRSYSDVVDFDRSRLVGAGAFTVAALPISVVYEPPQTGVGLTKTVFTDVRSVGNATRVGSSTESSTSRPQFDSLDVVKQKLSAVKSMAALYGLGIGGAIPTALTGISSALNTVDSTQLSGTSTNTDHTLETRVTESISTETNAGLGPGRGDRISYLKNAQLLWVMVGGNVTLTLIGWESRVTGYTAETLRGDLTKISQGLPTVSGLPTDTIRQLIALDPLASTTTRFGLYNDPTACMGAPRYQLIGRFEGDGPDTYAIAHTVTSADRVATTSYTSQVNDYHTGWASLLLTGDNSHTDTFKTSQSTERTLTNSTTVSATLQISADPGHPYHYDVFYDAIFGTFAVRNVPTSGCNTGVFSL